MAGLTCKRGTDITGRETRTVFILSISFCAVFSAFGGIQNLQSTINSEGGLGIISLSTVYGSFILSSISAPFFVKLFTAKGCIISNFIAHAIFAAANFYPVFWTMIPASALIGLTAGLIWTSQGMYVSLCAVSSSKNKKMDIKIFLGKYHGIFLLFNSFQNILGNVISSVILLQGKYKTNMPQNITENITYVVKHCGPHMCPDSEGKTESLALPDMTTVRILMGVFLALILIGLLLVTTCLPTLPVKLLTNRRSTKSTLGSCLKIHTELNLVLLIPCFLLLALNETFRWGDISKSYISCPYSVGFVGVALATHGLVMGLAAIIMSRLSRITGRQPIIFVSVMGFIAIFVIHFIWTPTDGQLHYLFLFMAFQGVVEGAFNSQLQALISFLFPGKSDASFSSFSTWRALGSTVSFVFSYFLCVRHKLILLLAVCGITCVTYGILEMKIRGKEHENPEDDDEVKEELQERETTSDFS